MDWETAADEFLDQLKNRQGQVARPNGTFYSLNVVTTAIQRIRIDLLKGASLTDRGMSFVEGAAAYLARLGLSQGKKRGLEAGLSGSLEGPAGERRIALSVSRVREGVQEEYLQDFLRDMRELLLLPPGTFPSLQGRMYVLNSLVYPSPEYLYLYGVFLLQSPRANGNWPRSKSVGGREEDFAASRGILIDDLHKDCGLPEGDQGLRALSFWVAFPPYGWDRNDAQEYNMMTLVDQIGRKQVVPFETGISYLRALLKSQLVFIRNLAARTLMVFERAPKDLREAACFLQALNAADQKQISGHMARFQWALAGNDPKAAVPPEWQQQCIEGWEKNVVEGPAEEWRSAPILHDPEYLGLASIVRDQPDRALAGLEQLLAKDPGNWFLRSALGAQLMQGSDPRRGEAMLRECLKDAPGCPDAHLNLGTRLKWQGRKQEAMSVFEEAVRRWPWHHQAVDSCMWLLTDDMVTKSS
jgi:tetratricopeptide (TPR) repeat protein